MSAVSPRKTKKKPRKNLCRVLVQLNVVYDARIPQTYQGIAMQYGRARFFDMIEPFSVSHCHPTRNSAFVLLGDTEQHTLDILVTRMTNVLAQGTQATLSISSELMLVCKSVRLLHSSATAITMAMAVAPMIVPKQITLLLESNSEKEDGILLEFLQRLVPYLHKEKQTLALVRPRDNQLETSFYLDGGETYHDIGLSATQFACTQSEHGVKWESTKISSSRIHICIAHKVKKP